MPRTSNGVLVSLGVRIRTADADKIDAIRLCKYACKESDELKMSKPLNPKLMQLKDLQTSRTRLLSQKNANRTYLKELKKINDKVTQKTLEQVYKTAIKGLEKSIDAIEKLMKKLISDDHTLQKSYDLLLSVPGIGNITAIYLIICTNNFAGNISGKQPRRRTAGFLCGCSTFWQLKRDKH